MFLIISKKNAANSSVISQKKIFGYIGDLLMSLWTVANLKRCEEWYNIKMTINNIETWNNYNANMQ